VLGRGSAAGRQLDCGVCWTWCRLDQDLSAACHAVLNPAVAGAPPSLDALQTVEPPTVTRQREPKPPRKKHRASGLVGLPRVLLSCCACETA